MALTHLVAFFTSTRALTVVTALTLVLAGGALTPRAEAGPNPCPPADAAVFFLDCFDLNDTNGTDDTDDSSTVDSANEDAWTDDEFGGDLCKIENEELAITDIVTPGP